MEIVLYELSTTKDLLTPRSRLVCIAYFMKEVGFCEAIDKAFLAPANNRGFAASVFVNALALMLHEGGRCLDDLRHIREDEALRMVLGLAKVPESDSVRD